MRTHCLSLTCSMLLAAVLAACGGSQPAPASPGEPGAAPAAEGAAEGDLVWRDDMPTKDKAVFMKKKVQPAMAKIFQEYDATKYANFSCKTCHGPDMKPKPVDALPELHVKDGKLLEADKAPEMAKFMGEKVEPEMARLFGKPVYDPKTNTGFGCNGCHKINM